VQSKGGESECIAAERGALSMSKPAEKRYLGGRLILYKAKGIHLEKEGVSRSYWSIAKGQKMQLRRKEGALCERAG